jgi:hypothetical protein
MNEEMNKENKFIEDEDEDEDEEIDLDKGWIDEFEEIDKNYADFYLEDVSYIKAHFIYVNKERDVEKIKREKIILKEQNRLSREEILMLLKKNETEGDSKYFLSSILKYNITLESTEVRKFCTSNYNPEEYVTRITSIDEIPFKKTITMFQDLNHLFFIFIEKPHHTTNPKNKSKRSSKSNNHNKTHRK